VRTLREPFEDAISVSSPISQEDLAAWTGASRAGVAEAMRALRELGWVHTQRRTLLVRDLEALRARPSRPFALLVAQRRERRRARNPLPPT